MAVAQLVATKRPEPEPVEQVKQNFHIQAKRRLK
jgi:hypothetical protein